MFSAQFIFKPGDYDEEFHHLDQSIDAYAATFPGFLGVERWVSVSEDSVRNSIYYFEDMETITEFAKFADHREAKSKVDRWYKGYRVVIAEVKHGYGDGRLATIA